MARAALVLLSMTALASVSALHVARCPPPLSLAQRRCSAIVAKTKRPAKKPAKKPKAEGGGFDLQSAMSAIVKEHVMARLTRCPPLPLQSAMVTAMKAHRDLWPKDPSRSVSVDVYVRAEGGAKFFFVGNAVGHGSQCDAPSAVLLQKRVVLLHARLLQPELEEQYILGKPLQLWTAPANSEMSVAQRRQSLTSLQGIKLDPGLRDAAAAGEVVAGFEPEQTDEASPSGFFVRLPPDGVVTTALEVKFANTVEAAKEMAAEIPGAEAQPVATDAAPVEVAPPAKLAASGAALAAAAAPAPEPEAEAVEPPSSAAPSGYEWGTTF